MVNIQGLSSYVLDKSKSYSSYILYLHLITFTCAALSIFFSGYSLYILAAIAFLAEITCWVINNRVQHNKSLGQKLSRLNIITESYQKDMKLELAYLQSEINSSEFAQALEFQNDNYFSTKQVEPLECLKENLQESCFWSQHLYKAYFKKKIKNTIIIALSIAILLLFSLTILPNDPNYSIPRLALLLLICFPLKSGIDDAISLYNAANSLGVIDRKLNECTDDSSELLIIFSEYSVSTSHAPLIPEKLYKKERDGLTLLWSERMKTS